MCIALAEAIVAGVPALVNDAPGVQWSRGFSNVIMISDEQKVWDQALINHAQNGVLTYGLSFARAVTSAAEVVGEINGRKDTREGTPPPGTESRGMVRLGGRYTIGSWRGDAAVMFGVTANDPTIGFGAGFTYVFNAPNLP